MLVGDSYNGQTVDMWSCGCSLYIMLVGNYPFRSTADNHLSHVQRMQAMFPRIVAGDYAPIPQVCMHSSVPCKFLSYLVHSNYNRILQEHQRLF